MLQCSMSIYGQVLLLLQCNPSPCSSSLPPPSLSPSHPPSLPPSLSLCLFSRVLETRDKDLPMPFCLFSSLQKSGATSFACCYAIASGKNLETKSTFRTLPRSTMAQFHLTVTIKVSKKFQSLQQYAVYRKALPWIKAKFNDQSIFVCMFVWKWKCLIVGCVFVCVFVMSKAEMYTILWWSLFNSILYNIELHIFFTRLRTCSRCLCGMRMRTSQEFKVQLVFFF